VDEASGYVSFTPIITASGPPIHLPLLALPRVTSALTALSGPIDLGSSTTMSFPLTIAGSASTTVITDASAPTHTIPLFGVFGLAHSSPPLTTLPTGEPLRGRYAQADLRYVGTAGPMIVDGERMVYFALVAYGAWSSPLEVTYQIAIAIDDEGANDTVTDFRLRNRESTDLIGFDFTTTDDFVSILEDAKGVHTLQGPLNVYASTQFDTRPFDTNVMVLPLRVDDLGEGVTRIRYQITSTSRDLIGESAATFIEATPVLSLDVGSAGFATGQGAPLFPVIAQESVTVTFDREAYIRQKTKGLLLLFLHNDLAARTQIVPVQYQGSYRQHLPIIGAP
jgi:hypothetical protein